MEQLLRMSSQKMNKRKRRTSITGALKLQQKDTTNITPTKEETNTISKEITDQFSPLQTRGMREHNQELEEEAKETTEVEDEQAILVFCVALQSDPGEPKTYKQSLKRKDSQQWKKAMKKELKSIEDRGVFGIVLNPSDMDKKPRVLNTRWIFKVKEDPFDQLRLYTRQGWWLKDMNRYQG